jgi:hypothetical protein
MQKLIGFVQNEIVTKIDSMSRRYMLFYNKNETKYNDIRIVNHAVNGQFFDLETGMQVNVEDIGDYKVYNDLNIEIFDSKFLMSNDELVTQYGIVLQDLG